MASLDALEREMLLDASLKKAPVAYALWFFLGGFGAHRFYLGSPGGVGMALLTVASMSLLIASIFGGGGLLILGGLCVLACFVWWVVDGFASRTLSPGPTWR